MPSALSIAADALHRGQVHAYGPHRDQRCELRLPPTRHTEVTSVSGAGGFPVVAVIHGGYWRTKFSKIVMRPVCADLTRRGWATWNIEYRRLGGRSGGGWPMTFDDVAAAIDLLAEVDAPLDLDRLIVLGHSAGGHLALWAAGRSRIAEGMPGAAPRVSPVAAIAQAPVANLERGTFLTKPGGVGRTLLGGGPEEVPERYEAANPWRMLALPVPALLVHGKEDETVTVEQSRDYCTANVAAGGRSELVVPTDTAHRIHIDPRSGAWGAVTDRIEGLLAEATQTPDPV